VIVIGVLALALLVATTAAAGPAPVPTSPSAGGLEIAYADGRVTADVRGMPRDEVITVLGERAGVEFYGELRDHSEVSAQLEGVRFRDVVDRLVGDQNFTIIYGASGRPVRVELWGMPASSPSARVPAPARSDLGTAIAQHPPVALPPLLVAAFRSPTARLPWLLRRGLRDRDAAVRSSAAAVFVRTLNGAPRLRSAVQRTDDLTLRLMIRSWVGTEDREVLRSVSSGATDPLVRSKALRILQQLSPAQGQTRSP
jgi:hypothetical protein